MTSEELELVAVEEPTFKLDLVTTDVEALNKADINILLLEFIGVDITLAVSLLVLLLESCEGIELAIGTTSAVTTLLFPSAALASVDISTLAAATVDTDDG